MKSTLISVLESLTSIDREMFPHQVNDFFERSSDVIQESLQTEFIPGAKYPFWTSGFILKDAAKIMGINASVYVFDTHSMAETNGPIRYPAAIPYWTDQTQINDLDTAQLCVLFEKTPDAFLGVLYPSNKQITISLSEIQRLIEEYQSILRRMIHTHIITLLEKYTLPISDACLHSTPTSTLLGLHAIALENTQDESEYARLISSMFSSEKEQELWLVHPYYAEWRSIHHEGLPMLIVNSNLEEMRELEQHIDTV